MRWGMEMRSLRDAELPALRFRRTQLLKVAAEHTACV